jgi:hypothetical protein
MSAKQPIDDFEIIPQESSSQEPLSETQEAQIGIFDLFDIEEGATFVYPEVVENEISDEIENETETVLTVFQEEQNGHIELTDEEMVEEILTYEPDLDRRNEMAILARLYDRNLKVSLLETLRANNGGTPKIADAIFAVEEHLANVQQSRSLSLRNRAASEHLQHYHNLAVSVSRAMRNNLKDDALSSLKIDGIYQHTKTLNTQLHTLASAITAMSEIIGGRAPSYDQPIDINALLKICTVVAYGCKTWASFYSVGQQQITNLQNEIGALENAVLSLKETISLRESAITELQIELTQIQTATKNGIYVIANSANFFLSSEVSQNEEGELWLSPATVNFTPERAEAVEFSTEQDARIALSYLKRWAKRPRIKGLTKSLGFNPDTFFVGSIVLHRVGE